MASNFTKLPIQGMSADYDGEEYPVEFGMAADKKSNPDQKISDKESKPDEKIFDENGKLIKLVKWIENNSIKLEIDMENEKLFGLKYPFPYNIIFSYTISGEYIEGQFYRRKGSRLESGYIRPQIVKIDEINKLMDFTNEIPINYLVGEYRVAIGGSDDIKMNIDENGRLFGIQKQWFYAYDYYGVENINLIRSKAKCLEYMDQSKGKYSLDTTDYDNGSGLLKAYRLDRWFIDGNEVTEDDYYEYYRMLNEKISSLNLGEKELNKIISEYIPIPSNPKRLMVPIDSLD